MNNDDMDDAFKKAAEEYELNQQLAADWKGVHEALQHKPSQPAQPVEEKKRRRFIFFWWLLIPAALLIMYGTGMFSPGTQQAKADKKEEGIKSPSSIAAEQSDAKSDINKAGKDETESRDRFNKTSADSKKNEDLSNDNHIKNLAKTKPANVEVNAQRKPGYIKSLAENSNKTETLNQQNHVNTPGNKELANTQNNKQKEETKNDNNNKEETVANNEQKKENSSSISDSTVNPSSRKSIDNYVRQAYKYAGISTNVDLSFIKNQKTSGIGLGAGIIAGYHFKNGFSIETGALYDKKNYYTKGAYFSKSRLNDYLQSSEILESEGNCKMWEIPLNIRYDFDTRKNYNWFVTTGISSYLMTKEYYDFTYKYNGDLRQHGYGYKNSSKDWFSVLNIGAGVSIKTGDKYLLQVQPYYKVPLKGVGIGSLSLNSTGINVNLVRRFK